MQVKAIYARIDVLDLTSGGKPAAAFTRVASVYLLGDAARHAKSVAAVHLRNNKLVSALGADVVKVLSAGAAHATGGSKQTDTTDDTDDTDGSDDEGWNNVLSEDLEDLLLADKEAVDEQEKTRTAVREDRVESYSFYSQDKATDIREMVALATNIDPYKQYIWLPNANQSLAGDTLSLMDHWEMSIQHIGAFPVDVHPRSKRSFASTRLEARLGSGQSPPPAVVITCVSLDSIARANASELRFLARSDPDSYRLVHANAVQRFFPFVSVPVFNQYLVDGSLVSDQFPRLSWSHDAIEHRYRRRMKLFADLKLSSKAKASTGKILTSSVLSLVFGDVVDDAVDRVDTLKLFQLVDITAAYCNEVADVDLYGAYNDSTGKSMRLRKVRQQDHYRAHPTPVMSVFGGINSKQQLKRSRTIVFNFLPRGEYSSLAVGLDCFGSVWIRARPSQLGLALDNFCRDLSPAINVLVDALNGMRSVFGGRHRLARFSYASNRNSSYRVMSSASRVAFTFSPSYPKLVDLLIATIGEAGLVSRAGRDEARSLGSVMTVTYGVSVKSTEDLPSVELTNLDGVAVIGFANLDIQETEFYLDLLARIVTTNKSRLELSSKVRTPLVATDPVLYRPQTGADKYRRICQRQFQPVVAAKGDRGAVEYRNFTFNRPEYYKCPSARLPVLGFLTGKHPQGFCLPCCRKLPQPNATAVRDQCTSSSCVKQQPAAAETEDGDDSGGRGSTYKVAYPTPDVPNSRIANRRAIMPEYVTRLLGLGDVVANGSVLAAHGTGSSGMDPESPEHLQTLAIIAASEDMFDVGRAAYASPQDLALDIVGMLKQPLRQAAVMRNELVSARFTTPIGFLHAFESQFMRETILRATPASVDLSSSEWNDLVVYLANCLGVNVLLLADDRVADRGIRLVNLADVDVSRPVLVLLKRSSAEWAHGHVEGRSMYLPVTKTAFRALAKSRLVLPRFDLSTVLAKIKRVTHATGVRKMWKQFSVSRCVEMTAQSTQYALARTDPLRKLVAIDTRQDGGARIVATASSLDAATAPPADDRAMPVATASLQDCLAFITDYNSYFANATPKYESLMRAYQLYLSAALTATSATQHDYGFVALDIYLLKLGRFVIYEGEVIGGVVNLVDERGNSDTSELIFFTPISVESVTDVLRRERERLHRLHRRVDAEAILVFPLAADAVMVTDDAEDAFAGAFIRWLNHPIDVTKPSLTPDGAELDCERSTSVKQFFDKGVYLDIVYRTLVDEAVVKVWAAERAVAVESFVVKQLQTLDPPPVLSTVVDSMVASIGELFPLYDTAIVRPALTQLIDRINALDRTIDEAVARVQSAPELEGLDLNNVYRWSHADIVQKVDQLIDSVSVTAADYPAFDLDMPVSEQQHHLFDPATKKLIVHADVRADLAAMLVADLENPFRRDYIINIPPAQTALFDIQPHVGELVFYSA